MSYHIEVRGLGLLDRVLGELASASFLRPALLAIASDLKARVAPYPPATGANRARAWRSGANNTWYERHYGPRWARKDGSVGGRQTSQALGQRWTYRVEPRKAIIGNNATYAPYVQDETKQAGFHKARGWRTAQGVIREALPSIQAGLENYVRDILRRHGA